MMTCSVQHERRPVVIESQGHSLIGVLHLPARLTSCPAVLVHHGYAGTKVGSGRLYVELAERLVQHGVATLRLDFRGCGDSEGDFSELGIEDWVQDSLNGIAFLRGCSKVDGGRVGLLGASLGGAIAAQAARRDENVQCLALWASVAVGRLWLEDWMRQNPGQAVDQTLSTIGIMANARLRASFLDIRTDEDVRDLGKLPLLHVEGGRDRIVLSGHARALEQARALSQAPSHFVVLPESDHQFSHPVERKMLLDQTTKWFYQTLEG